MFDINAIASALKDAGRADLHVQLIELSEKLREKEDQIHTLERENRLLREAGDLKARVFPRDEMYYVRQDDGNEEDGPFCTRCFDTDGKLIRLQVADWDQPKCPQCVTFQGPYKKQSRQKTSIDESYDPLSY